MPRHALVVPGRMLGPHQPLLYYAAAAARSRQATVERLDWQPAQALGPTTPADEVQAWVLGQVGRALDRLGGQPLLVAKSLGTHAAPLAADRGLPAVWLTPLLHEELVVEALRRARAPFLLVGGTADTPAWDGELARSLTPYVCEVPEADHGMHVPGPVAATAAVHGQVGTAVERFLDEVLWPAAVSGSGR